MKPLILTVLCLGFLLAACSDGDSDETVGLVTTTSLTSTVVPGTEVSESTKVVDPTPITPVCPEVTNPREQALRDALQKEGAVDGQTVSVLIEGCDIVGTQNYSLANQYGLDHPDETDPSAFRPYPDQEMRDWARSYGYPEDLFDDVNIHWASAGFCGGPNQLACSVTATYEVCKVLFEDRLCY